VKAENASNVSNVQHRRKGSKNASLVQMEVGRLFGNWRRSFASPRLAFLDLLDNAFDAAETGAIDVSTKGTHVVIKNTCAVIKPITDIMRLFASDKGANAIGENGIGLKQASAALSDTTLIAFRRGCVVGISILDKDLFSKQNILPQVEFPVASSNPSVLGETLEGDILAQLIPDSESPIRGAISNFGLGSFANGMKRITNSILSLFDAEFLRGSNHAFLVALKAPNCDITPELINVSYLHPGRQRIVTVDGKRIPFSHWPNRLVELCEYIAPISTDLPWHDDRLWDDKEDASTYDLNIYLGFDPLALKTHSAMRLYVYSRQRGRLVKMLQDGRKYLGLCSTGTQYGQGMVVIVDDMNGRLPLNPTKQDLSFAGNGEAGMVHEENLRTWISCASTLFYKHQSRKFDGVKTKLTKAVAKFIEKAKKKQMKSSMCCLRRDEFTGESSHFSCY